MPVEYTLDQEDLSSITGYFTANGFVLASTLETMIGYGGADILFVNPKPGLDLIPAANFDLSTKTFTVHNYESLPSAVKNTINWFLQERKQPAPYWL